MGFDYGGILLNVRTTTSGATYKGLKPCWKLVNSMPNYVFLDYTVICNLGTTPHTIAYTAA